MDRSNQPAGTEPGRQSTDRPGRSNPSRTYLARIVTGIAITGLFALGLGLGVFGGIWGAQRINAPAGDVNPTLWAPPASPLDSFPSSQQPTRTARPTLAPDPIEIRWFVGLGPGSEVFGELQALADDFNASQDEIVLVPDVNGGATAQEYLGTQIAVGDPPGIVGPAGIRGRDTFKGAWLDLQPLIDASGTDLSDYDPAIMKVFWDREEGQLGIPLTLYPSFIFVNKDLFDEAGLPYPPQEYGAPYVDENGEKKPWNIDTLRELAMKLTLDAGGNNATSPYFNAGNIVQLGYFEQFTDMRGALTLFGPGSLVADDGKTAQIPDHWRAGTKWIYDAMWEDHFWPTDAYLHSDLLRNGNPFQSGNLAMAHVHLWFAENWALGPDVIDFAWDTAAVPEYNGQVTAKMHADSFYIPKGAEHPEEAFKVLTYLLSEDVTPKLIEIFSRGISNIIPARKSLQDDYLAANGEKKFPGQDINWQVMLDSIQYADIPNHENWLPGFRVSTDAYTETWTRLAQEPDLDVDAELDALVEKLQVIFEEAGEQ